MRRRFGWILVTACMAAGAVAACGSDDQGTTEPPGGASGAAGDAGASGSGGVADAGAGGADAAPSSDAGHDADATSDGDAGADVETEASTEADAKGALDDLPAYPPVPYPAENPASADKAVLGKLLFWDEQVGSDDTMACGTCHRSGGGGSDPRASQAASLYPGTADAGAADDVHGGRGIVHCTIDGDGGVVYGPEPAPPFFYPAHQVTSRKPPTYLDAMFAPDIFWDGRATSKFTTPDTQLVAIAAGGALESQSMGPPVSSHEMACEGRTWPDILKKLEKVVPLAKATDVPPDMKAALAAHPTYPELFAAAFGDPALTTERFAFAVATHERRLTSDQTPYDRFVAGETTALTAAQRHGLELFMTKARCNLCHAPPLFTDYAFHDIGFVDPAIDPGRQAITNAPNDADLGKFKTPTLRNTKLREQGGLLHTGTGDGVSLELVMDLYNQGGRLGAPQKNLDPLMQPLGLTPVELADVVDFVRNGLTDPRVEAESYPFDRPKLGTEP